MHSTAPARLTTTLRSAEGRSDAPFKQVSVTAAPEWVSCFVNADGSEPIRRVVGNRFGVKIARSSNCAWATLLASNARQLSDDDFRDLAESGYDLLKSLAEELALSHLLRVWNVVPGLPDQSSDGSRYMTFNAGRFKAMRRWFGGQLTRRVPAATGVGHEGNDLILHALLSDQPGESVENPLQTPAYRYSERFGRMPPCFSRASRLGDRLFVSGTASVVGEESRHEGAFDQQLELTAEHLRRLPGLAWTGPAAYESLRIYLPVAPESDERIERVLGALRSLPTTPAAEIEVAFAGLCRPELLVEIEGVARKCPT